MGNKKNSGKPNQEVDVSFEIVLEKRERSYSFGEPRYGARDMTNMAEMLGVDAEIDLNNVKHLQSEKTKIRSIIFDFENLPVDQVASSHGKITTDPYTSIVAGKAVSVDRKALGAWMKSDKFIKLPRKGGKVELDQLNIVIIDEATASAQYQISQGGKTGNSSAVLVKNAKSQWRIAVHCQHPVYG